MKKYIILITGGVFLMVLFLCWLAITRLDKEGSITYNSTSMEPSVAKGSILVWKSINPEEIYRGDLLLYIPRKDNHFINDEANIFVSRVVGLPGDTIICTHEYIIINNKVYSFDKLRNIDLAENSNFTGELSISGIPTHLNSDEFFLVSDNWKNAVDSRILGSAKASSILGKVIRIISKN